MRRYGPVGLSPAQRADIWCCWKAGHHVRDIARAFGRDHGSIRNLLARRGGVAPNARTRGRLALMLKDREEISRGIAAGESGRSIADRRGRMSSPTLENMRLSHETIYRSRFIQARGVLKKKLIGHLRARRSMRRPHRVATHEDKRGQIPDAVSIRERPAEADDRAVPGHWEGDLISGSKNSHIVTHVERQSRFVSLIKVQNKETATVIALCRSKYARFQHHYVDR